MAWKRVHLQRGKSDERRRCELIYPTAGRVKVLAPQISPESSHRAAVCAASFCSSSGDFRLFWASPPRWRFYPGPGFSGHPSRGRASCPREVFCPKPSHFPIPAIHPNQVVCPRPGISRFSSACARIMLCVETTCTQNTSTSVRAAVGTTATSVSPLQ